MKDSSAKDLPERKSILVVDLEGTLIKSNLFADSLIQFLKTSPRSVILVFKTLFTRGDPSSHQTIEQRLMDLLSHNVEPYAAHLPYRQETLRFIGEHKAQGYRTALISSSPKRWTHAIADHLMIFDDVYEISGSIPRKGQAKLESLMIKHCPRDITFLGSRLSGLPLFQSLPKSHLVTSNTAVQMQIKQSAPHVSILEDNREQHLWGTSIRAMRVYQWTKNFLIFVPLLASHRVSDVQLFIQSTLAFFAFSFIASAVYIYNDIFDVSADRAHPFKRKRPYANGDLSLRHCLALMLILLSIGAGLAVFTSSVAFVTLCIGYFLANLAYTLGLKRMIGLDLLFLTLMFTLRIYAGSLVTGIPVSNWLLTFSTFFFFGLGALKRVTSIPVQGAQRFEFGHGYNSQDRVILMVLGFGASLTSLLVLALYIRSAEVTTLYRHSERLWLVLPLLLCWISRLWFLSSRGQIDGDPVWHILHDKVAYAIGILLLAIVVASV